MFEREQDGQILRAPSNTRGLRRLPLLASSEPAVHVSVDPAPEPVDLRELFAEELAALAEETRELALAEGKALAEQELAATREKLNADFAMRLREEQQKLDSHRQQLISLATALEAERERLADTMVPTVARLSMAVVLRMLGSHATSRALIGDLARRAIDEYRLDGVLRIRVSEADYQAVVDCNEDPDFVGMFHVDGDAELGTCVIDVGIGLIDASLDTQLDALKTVLKNAGGGRVGAG